MSNLKMAALHAGAGKRGRLSMELRGANPKGCPLWSDSEDAVCRKFYPAFDLIGATLQRRTYVAILHRCRKLGLSRTIMRWTAADISRLRRIYPTASPEELVAAFPGRKLTHIRSAAKRNHLRRRRRPYVETGDPLIDHIRQRCFDYRISMSELDRMVGSSHYFEKKGWRIGWINHAAIARAVKALDGNLRIEWNDG